MRYSLAISLVLVMSLAARAHAQPARCPYGPSPTGGCLDRPIDTPTGPRGLALASTPSGAEVIIGGKTLGYTPLRLSLRQLAPGRHAITFRLRDHEDQTITATVDAGRLGERSVKLVKSPVVVLTHDEDAVGAFVSVDGRQVEVLPAGARELVVKAGRHIVTVEMENHEPWTFESVFRAGDRIEKPVVLKPLYGRLGVGRQDTDDVAGIEVFVDGVSFGTTPIEPVEIRAGEHAVELRVKGMEPDRRAVYVPPRETRVVPVELPPLVADYPDPSDSSVKIRISLAISDCLKWDPSACIVAAYYAAKDDPTEAIRLYEAGCKRGNGPSCYAVGYIYKRLGKNDLSENPLATACNDGVAAACWAPYVENQRLPDPLRNPGDWGNYVFPESRKRGTIKIAVGGTGGLAIKQPIASYFELDVRFSFAINARFTLEFEWAARGRAFELEKVDESGTRTGETTPSGHGGLGLALGLRINPAGWPVSVRTAIRGTTYFPGDDGGSLSASLVYERGRNVFEAGVLGDTVPVRYQDVSAFGGDVRLEQDEYGLIGFLRYARVLEVLE